MSKSVTITNGIHFAIDITPENLDLIRKLLKKNINAYIMDDKDHTIDIEEMGQDNILINIFDGSNDAELFSMNYKYVVFYVDILESFLSNCSQICHNKTKYVFSKHGKSVDSVCKMFQNTRQMLINLGVPEDIILVGFKMHTL